MGYEYQKNSWESYNEDIIIEKQPDAIITKRKLDRLENGVERASMSLEVGKITTDNENPSASIEVDEITHTRKLNISFPKGGDGSESIDDNSSVYDKTWSSGKINSLINDINRRIDDITYEEIEIKSFSNNLGSVEKGSSYDVVTLSWQLNKTPVNLSINGQDIDVELTSTRYPIKITNNTIFTLRAIDEKSHAASKTTTVTYMNGLYFGSSSKKTIDEITSSFLINSLKKSLSQSYKKTFTVNASENQHIYFCYPTSMGTPSFYVGGFEGGFNLIGTFDFTNSYGYTEQYSVYISTNSGLGNTTVEVK